MHLPLFFKSDRLPCLIIGGGKVAAQKVETLLVAGVSLTVIAPEIEDSIRDAVNRGLVRWLKRGYQNGDCAGYHLVIAATACTEVNRAVFSEAQQTGIPVNVVDVPELCTVIFGASWNEGPLTISVSTGAVAPFMAAAIRDRVAEAARGSGAWVEAAGRFRTAVCAAVPNRDEKERLYRRFAARTRGTIPDGLPRTNELAEWLAFLDSEDKSK